MKDLRSRFFGPGANRVRSFKRISRRSKFRRIMVYAQSVKEYGFEFSTF